MPAAAQVSGRLYGTVIEKDTQKPIAGAIVIMKNSDTTIATSADSVGNFYFRDMPVGTYFLTAKFIGYESAVLNDVIVESGSAPNVHIALTAASYKMDEVTVSYYKDPTAAGNDMAVVSSRAISPEETKRFAGSLNDPSRMALSYAGVNSGQGDNNEIIIRGNSPRGLQWRLEGIEIPNPNHFGLYGSSGGLISILNSNNMGRSDFYLSAFPAQFGNALSGIFDLQLRNGNTFNRAYSVDVGSLGVGASAEGPFRKGGKASYIINCRYATLGLMKRVGIIYQAPDFQDITFKINIPTAHSGTFTVYGLGGAGRWLEEDFYRKTDSSKYTTGSNGKLIYAYDEIAAENLQLYNLGIIGAKHFMRISGKTGITTHVNVSATENKPMESDIDRSSYTIYLKNRGNYTNKTIRVQSQLKTIINAKSRIETGIIAAYMSFKSKLENGDSTGNINTILNKKDATGLLQHYIAWQYKPGQKWSVNTGIHTLYFLLSKEVKPEPRLGISYAVNDKSSVSIGAGIYSRHESPEAYFGYNEQTGLSPNLNLKLISTAQSALAYKRQLGSYLYLNTEVYFHYLYNVPVAADSSYFSLINEEIPFTNVAMVNKGEGYNYGIEATLEKRFSRRYYFLFTTSVFESKYKYPGSPGYRNTRYNNNFVINLVGGKEIALKNNRVIGVNLRSTLSGGKRYIPIDFQASVDNNAEVRDYSQAYSKQLAPYIGTDMSIYCRWSRPNATHVVKADIYRLYEQNEYDIAYQGERLLKNGTLAPPRIATLTYGEGQTKSTIFPVLSYRVTF